MLSTTGINMRNDSYVFWTSESPTMNMGRRETMCCILLALKSGNSQSSGTHVYLVISSDLLRGHLNSPSTWDLSYNGGFADICHLPFVKSHGFFPFASKCKLKTPISHNMEHTIGFDLLDSIADAGTDLFLTYEGLMVVTGFGGGQTSL
ncbi:unnamed protein product [Prorocentrum cordatum]|uniref:Uncharacterized protein n=1 Tax=Prorocentrum cordatum TaxID=2364126 RepID=A0ABN9SB57_9DINO|nr:unnamed protein product [Polarella glacialis]